MITSEEICSNIDNGDYDDDYCQFKLDCLECVGLSDHHRADRAWSMAWERGHSSGLYDVLGELQDLATLLID
jgi:hypothetical protein